MRPVGVPSSVEGILQPHQKCGQGLRPLALPAIGTGGGKRKTIGLMRIKLLEQLAQKVPCGDGDGICRRLHNLQVAACTDLLKDVFHRQNFNARLFDAIGAALELLTQDGYLSP